KVWTILLAIITFSLSLMGTFLVRSGVLTSVHAFAVDPAPAEGASLNPLLQDPGLAFHPPMLYLGYVGFSMAFSFAIAALLEGRVDAAWARWVRPWTLAAWMFLTGGIAMGSYWAYYELGWGGFWFWDPVENASFMPWLAGTALLHSALVMEKRDALKVWTILLAIITFSLSLMGTFLVRSGVLTSVHTFAVDPARGIFILAIMGVFIGGALALFAWRAPLLAQGGLFAPISREGALVLNNLLLTTACAAVFVGTLYPLALEAVSGEKISVGPPFFNLTFVPLFIPLFILMPFGQLLPWKRGDLAGVAQRLTVAFGAGLIFMAVLAAWRGGPAVSVILSGVAVYVILGSFVDLGRRLFGGGIAAGVVSQRARGLPRHAFGTAFAHAGLGVTLLGLAATGWGTEKITALKPGEALEIGPYELTFESVVPRNGPNYTALVGRTLIRSKGTLIATIEPATRFYPVRRMNRSEAGIATLGLGQVYMTIADVAANGTVNARIFWKPLVALIWIGALVMAFGGCLSLSDQSFRVGIARRARKAQAPRPQMAE
ncbi:MAG: heme lyase CcmF/NrfE family subunit, partial [Methylocella sp.]